VGKEIEMSASADARSGPAYGWMALAAFVAIVAGKLLLPFPGQQRAQNLSLAIEAMTGAALGLVAFRRLAHVPGRSMPARRQEQAPPEDSGVSPIPMDRGPR
jgi:hypothetical protein